MHQDPGEERGIYPIDQADGGCDDGPRCPEGSPWRSQIAAIEIRDEDAISDSGVEIWNLLESRGISHVILMGVHTNMCVLGRPFGLRQLARHGKEVVLVRDLTDTMYNSRSRPYVSHFEGTNRIIEHVEEVASGSQHKIRSNKDAGIARCGLEQPGDDPHQSRLARAIGTKESEHPVGNVEIDTLKRGNRTGIDLHEVSNGQHGVPFLQGY